MDNLLKEFGSIPYPLASQANARTPSLAVQKKVDMEPKSKTLEQCCSATLA